MQKQYYRGIIDKDDLKETAKILMEKGFDGEKLTREEVIRAVDHIIDNYKVFKEELFWLHLSWVVFDVHENLNKLNK